MPTSLSCCCPLRDLYSVFNSCYWKEDLIPAPAHPRPLWLIKLRVCWESGVYRRQTHKKRNPSVLLSTSPSQPEELQCCSLYLRQHLPHNRQIINPMKSSLSWIHRNRNQCRLQPEESLGKWVLIAPEDLMVYPLFKLDWTVVLLWD